MNVLVFVVHIKVHLSPNLHPSFVLKMAHSLARWAFGPLVRSHFGSLPSPSEDLSRERDRVGFLPFHNSCFFIVPEAARVTLRTLSFTESLRAVFVCSFATATFALSLSIHRNSLSRFLISPRTEVPVFNFLILISAYHILQSSKAGFFSLWHCILRIQCQRRLQWI